MYFAQQGDCLIKETKLPSEGLTPIDDKILVKSAVSNHTHRVVGELVSLFKKDEKIYIDAKSDFDVVHEEHKTLKIPAGQYFVDIVKEYDHFTEEARNVAD